MLTETSGLGAGCAIAGTVLMAAVVMSAEAMMIRRAVMVELPVSSATF
jgi:hypothetical protein